MTNRNKVLRFFLFSNLFISLCAAAAAVQTNLQAGYEPHWRYAGFVFCSTLVFYNLQRIFLSSGYGDSHSSSRHRWIVEHRKALIVISALALAASIPLFIVWELKHILLFAVFSGLAALYFLPFADLRAVPGLKAGYIALLWTFSTAFFPLLLHNGHDDTVFFQPHIVSLIIQRFLFILVLSIAFNIRDISADRSKGVRTLPVLFGERTTRALCILLLLFFCFTITFPLTAQDYALLGSAGITGTCIFFTSEKSGEHHYLFLLDGMILLQALLVGIS